MTVLAVLESTLPYSCLSYEIKCQETTVTVLTGLAVSAVVAVAVVTATPLTHPPFFIILSEGSGTFSNCQTLKLPFFCAHPSQNSVFCPPAILGPEMAVPILWAPGIFWFFLLENPNSEF